MRTLARIEKKLDLLIELLTVVWVASQTEEKEKPKTFQERLQEKLNEKKAK